MDVERALFWDSGLATGPRNAALDRAQMARSRARGEALLRLHRYHPTACLGAHEEPRHAVRAAYCAEAGIPVVRRPTGGGALYLDPDQLAWTLTAPLRRPDLWPGLEAAYGRLARGIAESLGELGIDARAAAPNDIEVGGRKLGSVFVALDNDLIIAQGTLLVDLDMEGLLKALRVPKEKLSPEGIQSARQRFTSLRGLLGEAPPSRLQAALRRGVEAAVGLAFDPSLSIHEQVGAQARALAPPAPEDRPQTMEAFRKLGGGVLYAGVRLDPEATRLERLHLSGDLDLHPLGLLADLEDWLQGAPLAALEGRGREFFARRAHELPGFTPEELLGAVHLAVDRARQVRELGLSVDEANTLMVHDPEGPGDARALLARAEVMLVPYCAKPAWCKWRHRDGCSECGLCEVGEAYRMARERGMQVISINNFEHLVCTLEAMREDGVQTYMGMCCRNFYLKREAAFRAAGMSALLLDITGSNCYELRQEDLAYAGKFEAEARLNQEVLEKVMRFVPSLAELTREAG